MFHYLLMLIVWFGPNQIQQGNAELIELLQSKDDAIRANAAKALATKGAKLPNEAIEPLVKALNDGNFRVQHYAVNALKGAGSHSEQAQLGLIGALENPKGGVDYQAKLALIQIGKPAVNSLARELSNKKGVRGAVAIHTILSEIGTEAKNAIPDVEKRLTSTDPLERIYAASAIIEIDPANKSVKDVLTAALKHSNVGIRLMVAESLARSVHFKKDGAFQAALDVLNDRHIEAEFRYSATRILSYFGAEGKPALTTLRNEYKDAQKTDLFFSIVLGGTIVKIDGQSQDVIRYLSKNRAELERMTQPQSARLWREFSKDLLKIVPTK